MDHKRNLIGHDQSHIQVSKHIFNKNDNNVGLLRTVKKYGYKKNTVKLHLKLGKNSSSCLTRVAQRIGQ